MVFNHSSFIKSQSNIFFMQVNVSAWIKSIDFSGQLLHAKFAFFHSLKTKILFHQITYFFINLCICSVFSDFSSK